MQTSGNSGEVYFYLIRPVIVKALQHADVYQFHIGYQVTIEFNMVQQIGVVVTFDGSEHFIAMDIDAKMITAPMERKYEALIIDHVVTRVKAARNNRPI